MMQATTSPSLLFPVMTCLPGLSRFLITPQFLMCAHAPIARERAQDLYVFAQGFWSPTCWRHMPGSPAVGPRVCVTAAHGLSSP
jgi:hypothetical protein